MVPVRCWPMLAQAAPSSRLSVWLHTDFQRLDQSQSRRHSSRTVSLGSSVQVVALSMAEEVEWALVLLSLALPPPSQPSSPFVPALVRR